MTEKRVPYILAGLVTVIIALMVPIIIQEFIAKNVSVGKRLMIISMPVLIGFMWYNVRKDGQINNENNSGDSVNNKSAAS
jgi:hypothetical protein